ncbi:hypothetical protein PGT21_022822 [Puccinia graminis f. sp. tritici]|uniref:Uncharacterized protein n=1 Tax=Puccinia graminis f. sp. tritici TaxID=56615 RepID=A0A5B0LY08_PUCGR|nr:hypothetical protein PGT21_022822 [Puccinia graminis f. sp. tritici]
MPFRSSHAARVTHSAFAILGVHPPSPLISRCSRYSQRIRYLSAFAILGVVPSRRLGVY